MTVAGFDAIRPPSDEVRETTVLVRFRAGVPVERGSQLSKSGSAPAPSSSPARSLSTSASSATSAPCPRALAGFLVLRGLGALGHVLATAVRRRRHDLAVLRAMGFRPLQVAGCVSWQAVTVSLVALLLGIPLGIAVGRWSWRWVADSTPLL